MREAGEDEFLQHGIDFSFGVRHQVVHSACDDLCAVYLRVLPYTLVQQSCQAAEQGLKEGVDGHDLDVIEVEQHLPEALAGTFSQFGIRRLRVTHHELARA